MLLRRKTYAMIALIVLLWAPEGLSGQNSSKELLDRRLQNLDIKEANAHLALSQLSKRFGIAIGVEVAKGANNGPEIHLNVKDGSLREVLDAVVEQDGRYEWSVSNSVINVTPKSDRDVLLEDLLETNIDKFSIGEKVNTFDLRVMIVDLPEVRAKLKMAGLAPRISAYTNADTAALGDRFTLTMSQTTLKGVLNEIVRSDASQAKFWIVNRLGDHGEYFLLNFSVFEGPPLTGCFGTSGQRPPEF
jgi:hypothetical protein